MRIIKPYYKILSNIESEKILKNIEYAGRICYKSDNLITDESSKKFIKMLIERGHESVLEHEKLSILFVCDRGVSHELVRHRIASFSQESTRYCNYTKDKFDNQITYILPPWIKNIQEGIYTKYLPKTFEESTYWFNTLIDIERAYNSLINQFKWQPQQARSILPNSLKTEIIVTANFREWRTILKQRTAIVAHPQIRELMCPLLDELKLILPVIFDDIVY